VREILTIKRMPYGDLVHDKTGDPVKPRVLTKTFFLVHGTYLAANVFDIEMTHQGIAHHNCVEAASTVIRIPLAAKCTRRT
jgi:hypothetical protein